MTAELEFINQVKKISSFYGSL